METTIRLSEEVLQSAQQHALSTKRTLTQLIQDAVVLLIEQEKVIGQDSTASLPCEVKMPTFRGDGAYPGVDINNNAALRDCMELAQEDMELAQEG